MAKKIKLQVRVTEEENVAYQEESQRNEGDFSKWARKILNREVLHVRSKDVTNQGRT